MVLKLNNISENKNLNPLSQLCENLIKMGKSRLESLLTFPICLKCIIYCNVKYIQDTFMAKLQKIAYN